MTDEPRAIVERLEAENRVRREKFEDGLDRWMDEARSVGRDALYRITALSASIVAFSATLLSINELDVDANEGALAASWCLFAAVVILAPAVIALEARAKFAVAWRARQPQHFDSDRRPTNRERLKLYGVAAYSLTLRPRNLIYARDTDYDAEKPTQGMWMNFRMILTAKFYDVAPGGSCHATLMRPERPRSGQRNSSCTRSGISRSRSSLSSGRCLEPRSLSSWSRCFPSR